MHVSRLLVTGALALAASATLFLWARSAQATFAVVCPLGNAPTDATATVHPDGSASVQARITPRLARFQASTPEGTGVMRIAGFQDAPLAWTTDDSGSYCPVPIPLQAKDPDMRGRLRARLEARRAKVFRGIRSLRIRHIGINGLTETALDAPSRQAVVECLYDTKVIPPAQASRRLLQTTYLIEISDLRGSRSFELYTEQNLKGNKGRYYENGCLHDLIVAAQ